MNWKLDHSANLRGVSATITFDLSKETPPRFLPTPDLLMATDCSVEVVCNTCTGTSGAIKIHETNNRNGASGGNYDTTLTVALGVTTSNYTKVANVLSQYLALEMPAGTVGSTGTLSITVIGKS